MNRGRIFRRRFDTRMDRLQHTAGQIEDQIEKVRDQAREGLVRGREAFVSLEQSMVRNIRKHPALYAIAGLALLSLLVASILRDRRA